MAHGLHRLKDGLARLIGERGYGNSLTAEVCESAWKEVAGELLSSRTQIDGLRRNTLEITVSDSVSMQELAFQKPVLLQALRQKLPEYQLHDLRFRIGHINQ